MKVTIDTKQDSKEEVQKAVEFLQTIMQMNTNQPSSSISSQASDTFATMFSEPATAKLSSSSFTPSSQQASAKPKADIPKVEVFDVDDIFEDEK